MFISYFYFWRRIAHNEIYAHGVLEHPNIVRNYSSWTENDYVFMQNEYCNGGSLEEMIANGPIEERQLKKVMEHIAQGLRYVKICLFCSRSLKDSQNDFRIFSKFYFVIC